ncbi:MAG: hypothetical protein EAZ43_02820 [Betaproteobacteria bacterium]|nr:MAG: hypothetical protein EAZ43_02820 [Betaproteobacteria bacterium]
MNLDIPTRPQRHLPALVWHALSHRMVRALLIVAAMLGGTGAMAEAPTPTAGVALRAAVAPNTEVSGLIVKFAAQKGVAPMAAEARSALVARSVARLRSGSTRSQFARNLANGAELHRFDSTVSIKEAQAMAALIAKQPGIEYAAPNRVMRNQFVPSDPDYAAQWGFQYVPGVTEGANFEAAWDVVRGSPDQTIGIIDSGITKAHEAFAGRLRSHAAFPNGGYDFVASAAIADDGDGRDNDPEQAPSSCGHGTHVAGTIAANTAFSGTGEGVAGGAPLSLMQMARGLNFTGDDADIIDAMLWLSGLSAVNGQFNPSPVRVINMSLGGGGACGSAYQATIDAMRAVGTLAVIAAGNDSGNVSGSAPANCRGVVAVAASTQGGNLASFSNFGAGVTLTAPGANILSVGGVTNGACYKSGTSMAAPHVTAAVALLQARIPSLSVSQTILALRAGARAFLPSGNCTTSACGAGLLDAYQSLQTIDPSAAPRVGWATGAVTLRENDGSVTLNLTRIGASSSSVSATINFVNGTAVSGTDFVAPVTTTVHWAAGDVSDQTISIPIVARSGEQGTRQFSAQIASVTGGGTTVEPAIVPITITEVDCNTVIPMAIGDTVTGTLGTPLTPYCRGGVRGPAFDTVRYRFTGVAGQRVSIALNSTQASPVLDPYLYLLDADKKILAENDDISGGVLRNSLIQNFVLPSSGTFFIDVSAWSSTQENVGPYALQLSTCGTYVAGLTCNLDIDSNDAFDGNDGLLIVRRMMGVESTSLKTGLTLDACAERTIAEDIGNVIDAQLVAPVAPPTAPIPFDIDNDGKVLATTDGLILLRASLGIRGDALVAGATAAGALRSTWPLVRTYLNTSCGMNLLP